MELVSGHTDTLLHTGRCQDAYNAALTRLPGLTLEQKDTLRDTLCTNYIVFETGITNPKLVWLLRRILAGARNAAPDSFIASFMDTYKETDPYEIHAAIQNISTVIKVCPEIDNYGLFDSLDHVKYTRLVILSNLDDTVKEVDISTVPDSAHVCGKCRGAGRMYRKTYVKAQLQIRSPDEPMTTFCCCYICKHEWNF